MKTNRITKLAFAGICGASLLLSGCMTAALSNYDAQQFETTTQPPTSPDKIVLATNIPDCKYQNLGSIGAVQVRHGYQGGYAEPGCEDGR
jgi:PBP1b-binding outer membrane lipoprotein LpoB